MVAKIKFNIKAFRELRSLPETKELCHEIAVDVATAAGDGFVVEDRENPRSRARSAVVAETNQAKAAAGRGDLQRALEAGRRG